MFLSSQINYYIGNDSQKSKDPSKQDYLVVKINNTFRCWDELGFVALDINKLTASLLDIKNLALQPPCLSLCSLTTKH